MPTNTLIEETISILCKIRPRLTGKQEEMCGYAIDNLRLAVWLSGPPEPLPEPSNVEGDPSAIWLIEGQYEVNTDPPVS